MAYLRTTLVLLSTLALAGCYHARVETGLAPGSQVIDRAWAPGFVYGLVPPPTVEAGEACPDGVAVVETELSFLNQVVSALTLGIYTPMHIRVTCAAASAHALPADAEAIQVAAGSTSDEVIAAFSQAADRTVATHQPVLVRFE